MTRPVRSMKVGDVVRYRKGATALMKVERLYDYGGKIGIRFEGMHVCGGHHEAYESDCIPASEEDKKHWQSLSGERNASWADWVRGHDDTPFGETA